EFGTAPSPFIARAVRWRRDVWGRLLELGAATVAAVHGYAVGGGMEMALLCDLCVAATDARFALPETGLGMIPGVGGTQTLPRRAGTGRALDVVLTGRRFDARDALAAGIVQRVVPRRRLEATALAMARALAARDPALDVNSHRYVEAYYATSMLGGVFIPLNYRAKLPELEHMLGTGAARVLLVGARYLEMVETLRPTLPALEVLVGFDGPTRGRAG